jgi:serine protease Do
VIDSVQSDSPAERAGLRRGDVILSVDGQSIRTGDELVSIVSDTEIGKKLKVEYLRDGKRATTDVVVEDRSRIIGETRGQDSGEEGENPEEAAGVFGVSVKNLTPDQAKELSDQLHLAKPQGVLVTDVEVGGFAADMGVQRGDVILSINRQPVASVDDFNRMQSQSKSGDDVVFLVARRSGTRSFTTLFLAERLP